MHRGIAACLLTLPSRSIASQRLILRQDLSTMDQDLPNDANEAGEWLALGPELIRRLGAVRLIVVREQPRSSPAQAMDKLFP